MGGSPSALWEETFEDVRINYDSFRAKKLTKKNFRLQNPLSLRTMMRAKPRSTARPWLVLKGSDTLGAYYEFFDGTRRVVLVGEHHGSFESGPRNLKRYDEDWPMNDVLVKFLEAKRDPSIQTIFMLERPMSSTSIRTTISGGGIFEPLSDRSLRSGVGRYRVDPSFDPFVLEEPEEKIQRSNVNYLADQLMKHRQTVINVDPRQYFVGRLLAQALYYPKSIFGHARESVVAKSMEGAIERHHLMMEFCYMVIRDVNERLSTARASFEALFRDQDRIRAVFEFYCSELTTFEKMFADKSKQSDETLRELYTSYQALDIHTITWHYNAYSLVSRLLDFYSVGKILQLPENSLTVMYAGKSHICYIAQLLMLKGTGFELDHVGIFKDSGKFEIDTTEDTETLRVLHYMYRDFADSNIMPTSFLNPHYYNAINIGVLPNNEKLSSFKFASNCILFGDSALTKRVIEFARLREKFHV